MAKKPRDYSAEERRAAVQRSQEIGACAAARELGIPEGTVFYWRHQARSKGAAHPASASNTCCKSTIGAKEPESGGAQRVARVYAPSERARALEYAAEHGVTATVRKYGMSRFSIYAWRHKARLHTEGKLAESPVVGSDEDPKARRDRRILKEWKARPGLGPSQIRNQLRRQGLKVSVHTVRCVLEENGYVTPKVRRQEVHDQGYEAVRPNCVWHLDFLHRHIHKQRVCALVILDDWSRFIVGGSLWDGERVAPVCEAVQKAVSLHGKPEKVMSDGGSAFYAWRGVGRFTRLLEELEIDQLVDTVRPSLPLVAQPERGL